MAEVSEYAMDGILPQHDNNNLCLILDLVL